MIELKQNRGSDQKTDYHGFTLQPGFWYGYDHETKEYVASSGWEVGQYLALYRKNNDNGEWAISWLDETEEKIAAYDFQAPDLEHKKTFNVWLKESYGILPEEYDKHYCGTFADEVEANYGDYYYDGLPIFARTKENIERADHHSDISVFQNCDSGKVFTYRDGFRRSVAPYLAAVAQGNLAAAGSAFHSLNADRSAIYSDVEARKVENLNKIAERADTLQMNCYQLLRGNGVSGMDAKRIIAVYLNNPDFFEKTKDNISDANNQEELEAFKNRYEELQQNGFSSVITEAIQVLSMAVEAEQTKAKEQILATVSLETKAYEKEYMDSIMHVYSIGREAGLEKQELQSVFPRAAVAHQVDNVEKFFDGLESAFARNHEQLINRQEFDKMEFMQELQKLQENCKEAGISEDSMEYELRLEALYEKYQLPEQEEELSEHEPEQDTMERE